MTLDDETTRADRTLDLVAELLRSGEGDRPHRLAKLSKPVLVHLAAVLLARLHACRAGDGPKETGTSARVPGGTRR